MASRLFYGSRPKHKAKPDSADKPSGLPKPSSSSSIPSAPTKPKSKIPAHPLHTSATTKGKGKEPSGKNAMTSIPTPLSGTNVAPPRSQIPKKEMEKTASLISRGLSQGMGNRTEITSKPMPQRRRLVRKASAMDQHTRYVKSEPSESNSSPSKGSSSQSSDGGQADPSPGMILGLSIPPTSAAPFRTTQAEQPTNYATSNSRMAAFNPKQPSPVQNDLSPPTPGFAQSSSSSTRYSESPGPFSRTSTPTSASSHSPGILSTPKFGTRARPTISPTRSRPPIVRRKVGGTAKYEESSEDLGLPPVRESQTSSSSSSTVKASEMNETSPESIRMGKKKAKDPPPTPPLRLSSKKVPSPVRNEVKPAPREQTRIARPPSLSGPPPSRLPSKLPQGSERPNVPPPRPSREKVPTLDNIHQTPVIQSNLQRPPSGTYSQRPSLDRPSLESRGSSDVRPSTESRRTQGSKSEDESTGKGPRRTSLTSGLPKPGAKSALPKVTSPHLVPRDASRNRQPPKIATDIPRSGKRDPSPLSTTSTKSTSRFGFFSRRLKSPSDTNLPAEKPDKLEKLKKKGPAAGTGHEGYGRYAPRGRSASAASGKGSGKGRGRSTSTEESSRPALKPSSRKSSFGSNDGQPEMDDFYKERLEPVVIGGGGLVRENRNSQSSLYLSMSGQTSTSSFGENRPPPQGLMPPFAPVRRPSDDGQPAGFLRAEPEHTLAHRRSFRRLGAEEIPQIPPPIDTHFTSPSPGLETYDSALSSFAASASSLPLSEDHSEGSEGFFRKKGRKWNIFPRPQRSSPPSPAPSSRQAEVMSHSTSMSSVRMQNPVAHYAIMDETDIEDEEQDLEDILRNIEGNLDLENEDLEESVRKYREPSVLLPAPPKLSDENFDGRPASPKVTLRSLFTAGNQPPEHPPPRPSLEARVPPPEPAEGRYPPPAPPPGRRPSRLKQIGRIPQVVSKHSRQHQPHQKSFSRPFAGRRSLDEEAPDAQLERPNLELQTNPLPTAMPEPEVSPPVQMAPQYPDKDFMAFPLPKDSELSASSSSGIVNLAKMTAVKPIAQSPLSEDEVWREFDEFIDNVASPLSPGSKASSKLPVDFPFDTQREFPLTSKSSRTFAKDSPRPALPERPMYLALPGQDIVQSPKTLSELYTGYANRASIPKANPRHSSASMTSGSRYSSQTIFSQSGSRSSLDSMHLKRVTQVMAQKTIATSDSLRFSALMTSRWLSFDRVLFSPAQEEVHAGLQNRVLVIDGLENDDWAAYCALNYPNAVIYNLSSATSRQSFTNTNNSNDWVPPSNLRRISYSDTSSPLPFPKGFFTVVVFRFPVASSMETYRYAVSECKRVLRPGGYLELSILDMDMVNMGNRARRMIRGVKMEMQRLTPEVNLNPASDTLMKFLGRKGFENVNRCVVGVPVAGAIASPTKAESGYSSAPRSANEDLSGKPTLADLLSGRQAEKGGPDPHFMGPQMIARVGRWWWSLCYESGLRANNDSEHAYQSIWDDRQLLRECESQETGLKLLVCYAQKPESPRRRTASV